MITFITKMKHIIKIIYLLFQLSFRNDIHKVTIGTRNVSNFDDTFPINLVQSLQQLVILRLQD